MSALPEIRVLFRAAAGSRRGFGHLVRCRSLARALGVRPLVCVRGTAATRHIALRLGCDVVEGPATRLLTALKPDVLVLDDPIATHASAWISAARTAGVPVVTIHDLGLGCTAGDLAIDGSVVSATSAARRSGTAGPAFAILDPAVAETGTRVRRGVLISLGGGPRAEMAGAIAREIAKRAPWVRVRVAAGFISGSAPNQQPMKNITWLGATDDLASELSRAKVAVVGGGVSLYEACALGTAAVAVPVVRAQRATVAGFVSKGAALGRPAGVRPRQIAEDVVKLLESDPLRHGIARRGRRLVDGHGAERAARAIGRLLDQYAAQAARQAGSKGLRYAS